MLSWEAEWQHFADTCPDPAVGHVWSQIRRELAEVPIERDGFGFVHNDPHLHSQVTHLVDGYLTAYPLDQRWIDALPLFIEYRRALLLMAMHAELPQQVRAAWHTEPWSTVGPRSTRRGRC